MTIPLAVLTISFLTLGCSPITSADSGAEAGPAPDSGPSPDSGAETGPGALHYFSDPCGSGDPVGCVFTNPVEIPDPTTKKCSELGIVENDACTRSGDRCVLVPARQEADGGSGCRQSASYLTCLAERRDAGPGGCPVSSRAKKTNVHYLDDAERARVSREILELRVASYDYTDPADGPSPTVGFILEDAKDATFVIKDRSRVNMYSYTTSLVVTVQRQQAEIDRLSREIAELKKARCR